LGAVAKFAASGKDRAKKDLGLLAITYGNIYVAQIAIQTNPNQAVKALIEAEEYDGSALIIAYSNCIEHGYDLRYGVEQQRLAVASGYWPLYRYNPSLIDRNPLQLDAVDVKVPLSEYLKRENRFQILAKTQPKRAEELLRRSQEVVNRRIAFYKKLAE
jgi:pyruvate-ferredoxin/flavodoxin oxidoreductase